MGGETLWLLRGLETRASLALDPSTSGLPFCCRWLLAAAQPEADGSRLACAGIPIRTQIVRPIPFCEHQHFTVSTAPLALQEMYDRLSHLGPPTSSDTSSTGDGSEEVVIHGSHSARTLPTASMHSFHCDVCALCGVQVVIYHRDYRMLGEEPLLTQCPPSRCLQCPLTAWHCVRYRRGPRDVRAALRGRALHV
jgi:hypothetical protein